MPYFPYTFPSNVNEKSVRENNSSGSLLTPRFDSEMGTGLTYSFVN